MAWFFGLHNYAKPGRGVRKDEPPKTGIALYFDILIRRFWNIITLNIFYIVFSVPAIVVSFFLSTFLTSWSVTVVGIDLNGTLGDTFSLIGLLCSVIIFLIFGSGPASAGMTYVLRNYVNDTHSWVWGDFYENFKSNFKQGMAIYLINIISIVAFVVGFIFYTHIMTGAVAYLLKSFITALALIFVMMQMYIYTLMVSFDLSVKKIYKYAAILVIAKLPTNMLAFVVLIALIYLLYELMLIYPSIAVVLMLTLIFGLLTYTQIFMTNNVVKKYFLKKK